MGGTKPILVQRLKDAIALDGVPQPAQPVPVDAFDQVAGQNAVPNAAEDDDAMEDTSTEQVENVSNDVQEAEMEETANENDEGTEEAAANVSVSQDQEMKTEESTKVGTPVKNEKPT